MQKEKILVTGGSGFIGKNLINKLKNQKNLDVTATYFRKAPPKINGVNWLKVDLIRNKDDSLYKGIDKVYMLAAISSGAKDIIERPDIFVTDNALINQNTIIGAVNRNVKNIIFPSCSVMYKNSTEIQDEKNIFIDLIDDKYIGGATMKMYIEGLCKFYSKNTNTRFSIIRHTNTYGPHDKFNIEKAHVFAASIIKTDNNPNEVEIWGDGEEGRDLLYVDDLVELMIKMPIMQKEEYDLICAGSENLITINDLVNKICKIRKINPIIKHNLSKPNIPINIRLSHQRALKKYG